MGDWNPGLREEGRGAWTAGSEGGGARDLGPGSWESRWRLGQKSPSTQGGRGAGKRRAANGREHKWFCWRKQLVSGKAFRWRCHRQGLPPSHPRLPCWLGNSDLNSDPLGLRKRGRESKAARGPQVEGGGGVAGGPTPGSLNRKCGQKGGGPAGLYSEPEEVRAGNFDIGGLARNVCVLEGAGGLDFWVPQGGSLGKAGGSDLWVLGRIGSGG